MAYITSIMAATAEHRHRVTISVPMIEQTNKLDLKESPARKVIEKQQSPPSPLIT